MLSFPRASLLLCSLCLALAACSDSSSTHVAVKVDNSIDDPNHDPNLIVRIVVRDEDETAPLPVPTPSGLQAAVRAEFAAPAQDGELAYRALAEDGSALGVVSPTSHWIEPDALGEPSDLTWSFDGTTLFAVGRDQLLSATGSGGRPLIALDGASAADGGPALDAVVDGEPASLEVIAAIGRAPGGFEDVFAIYVDPAGAAVGLENLTRTPDVREIDAAWLHDGTRLAVLERSDRDAIAVRNVVFSAGVELPVRAELERGSTALWQADAGTLRDLSAARTRELLAVSAWTGRDWDVICIDGRGNVANLGTPDLDESAPSWSRGDRLLAVEQRCTSAACTPLPILIWQLDYAPGSTRCPRVAVASSLATAGALPAWRP